MSRFYGMGDTSIKLTDDELNWINSNQALVEISMDPTIYSETMDELDYDEMKETSKILEKYLELAYTDLMIIK